MNNNLIFLVIGSTLLLLVPNVYASDAYDSGYDHGCNDSDFRYPGDRYTNQPGNGPSKQSDEFMNGYENGINACNDKGYENTADFPELDQGESYGTCEERSVGLVCDIEENRK